MEIRKRVAPVLRASMRKLSDIRARDAPDVSFAAFANYP
jgi:hypothetical protein